MSEWQTYRLEDFLAFTPEVYFRLIERANEAFWPLHLLLLVLGLAALVLAWRGFGRLALLSLVPAWLTSGTIFHLNYYAEINVAATWFGWAFIAQAGVLALLAAAGSRADSARKPQRLVGLVVATAGLLAWPLILAWLGGGWSQAEVFALHPDPTAVSTLGVIFLAASGLRAGIGLSIPVAWCVVATLSLLALDAPWAAVPAGIAMVAVLSWAVTGLARRFRQP